MPVDAPLGVYQGVVVNTDRTKVRARVPQVLGDAVSNWALPLLTSGLVPPTGSQVWVMFQGGDVNRPMYLPGASGSAELLPLSVGSEELKDNAVIQSKVADGAITTRAIAAGAVAAGKLAEQAVAEANIADNAVTARTILADSILATHISAGAVEAEAIATGAVTTAKLDALAVTSEKIAALSINAGHIVANSITGDKLVADTITGREIDAETITADNIAVGTITADRIVLKGITGDRLADNTITADHIVAGAVTADKLSANAINGKTITASTFKTDDTARWIEMGPATTFQGQTINYPAIMWMKPDQPTVSNFNAAIYSDDTYLVLVPPIGAAGIRSTQVGISDDGVDISARGNATVTAQNATLWLKGGLGIDMVGPITAHDEITAPSVVVNITPRNGGAAASGYPQGITTFDINTDQTGWPTSFGNVLTFNTGRICQIYVANNGQSFARGTTGGDWNPWQSLSAPNINGGHVSDTTSAAGGVFNISHGLGVTPKAINVTMQMVNLPSDFITSNVVTRKSSTTFDVYFRYGNNNPVYLKNVEFDWIAYA